MRTLIDSYLLVKESEGRAASTLYEYNLYLTSFMIHCGKQVGEITNADVAAWIVAERAKGYADASILARFRAVRIFINWCVANDHLPVSPIRMKNPKIKKHRPRIATHAHIQKLLAHPATDWTGYRNRALVHLLYDTGMRIGEAVSLFVSHVDQAAHLAHIPPGKDGEGRSVPFTKACAVDLAAYLTARPCSPWDKWLMTGGYNGGSVAGRLTTVGARQALKKLCRAAGIPYVNPHSIRHLFATKALNAGIRVEVVSRILGHSSVDFTLSVYASLTTDSIQKEYNDLWKV